MAGLSFNLKFLFVLDEPKLARNISNSALEQRGKQSEELGTENLGLTRSWHDYTESEYDVTERQYRVHTLALLVPIRQRAHPHDTMTEK